jgi:hypothetical protein
MKLNLTQDKLFNLTIGLSYILYFFVYFGILSKAPEYLFILQTIIKLYISLYLIYKFNYFSNLTFTKLDRKISFNAGVFLLTTIMVGDLYYFIEYLSSMF